MVSHLARFLNHQQYQGDPPKKIPWKNRGSCLVQTLQIQRTNDWFPKFHPINFSWIDVSPELPNSGYSRQSYCFGWWQLNYFWFSPRTLGKIPILTNIFQRGWNHQLVLDASEIQLILGKYLNIPHDLGRVVCPHPNGSVIFFIAGVLIPSSASQSP